MNYWFLAGIVLLGTVTSYEDIRFGKIRNKWITLAVLYAILVNIGLILYNNTHNIPIRGGYFIEIAIMAFFSLLTGLLIWHLGFWTPGDAKLFFAYSLLIPLDVYKYGYLQDFSSVNILVNTFVPVFLFMAGIIFFKTSLKQKIFYLKKAFEPKKIGQLFVYFFSLSWLVGFLVSLTHVKISPFLYFALIFVFIIAAERLLEKKLFYALLAAAVLRIFLDRSLLSIYTVGIIVITWIVFILLRFFVLYLGFELLTKEVDISLLRPGMVAAESVYIENGKYKKEQLSSFSLSRLTKKRKLLFENGSEGLSENDIKTIRKAKVPFEHLRVQQTLSFAPFLLGGVILTIIFSGNIVYYAIALFLK